MRFTRNLLVLVWLCAWPAVGVGQTSDLFSDALLEQRFAPPPSQFIEIDGVRLHWRDEGRGPPLLLLNGHLGSLHMWDAWMPSLRRHFRVLRVDYPPYGLSGPTKDNRYDTARAAGWVRQLVDRLQLPRVHIGGTSNGALVALFFAIENPQRVDRLVLSQLPAGRPPPRTPSPALIAASASMRSVAPFQPREFWQAFLDDIVANKKVVTPPLIERYFLLNNRIGGKQAVDAYIQSQYQLWDSLDVPSYYARLRRPVLLQWGADGVVLPARVGDEVAALLSAAPCTLRQYRGAGHLPMIEQPRATVRDAIAFLRAKT